MRRFEVSLKRGEKNPVKSDARDSNPPRLSKSFRTLFEYLFPGICSYIYWLPTTRTPTKAPARWYAEETSRSQTSFALAYIGTVISTIYFVKNFINHTDTNASSGLGQQIVTRSAKICDSAIKIFWNVLLYSFICLAKRFHRFIWSIWSSFVQICSSFFLVK